MRWARSEVGLYGRIPPGVHVDDVTAAEIESRTARLEAD